MGDQPLPVGIQLVEIVPLQRDAVRACIGDDIVIEVAVVNTGHAPVGAAEVGGHPDHLRFDM